jgi:hypothetical protein
LGKEAGVVEHLLQLRKIFGSHGVIFCYSGPFSQQILVEIGESLRGKIQEEDHSLAIAQNVFAVFVEKAQNICYYSSLVKGNVDDHYREGLIVVGHKESSYFVTGGNIVDAVRKDHLEAHLKKLNSLSKEELKLYYKQVRKSGPESTESRGAGLGWLEIAKRSSGPIQFQFERVNDDYFFSYTTLIA